MPITSNSFYNKHAYQHQAPMGLGLQLLKGYNPMNTVCALCVALLCVSGPLTAATVWHTDYFQVRTLSQQENKPVLLFFNGSDWSGEAMWMKHEVLCTPSFEEKIVGHFICMEVDFPQHSQLADHIMAQNQVLKERFLIEQTPALLLLDTQERVIAQIGYLPENGDQFAGELLKVLEQDAKLVKGLESLDKNLDQNAAEMIILYQIAQELGSESAQEQILEAGLRSRDSYFFLREVPFACRERRKGAGFNTCVA